MRGVGVQVLVDISTPAATFDCVDAAVAAHLATNPSDFTGKHLVVANNAGDPLKYMLCVWWEYCHQGGSALHCLPDMLISTFDSNIALKLGRPLLIRCLLSACRD